jgi:DsbC/DsbD-like thiol-disulfide interchange protein
MLSACALFLAYLASVPWSAPDQEPESEHEVATELLSTRSSIAPGCEFELGVKLTIPAGWHVYWLNPGDTGVATSVHLATPDGFEVEGPLFPGPVLHDDAGLTSFVHEGELLLFYKLRAPKALAPGPQKFSAKVRWLVCREVCFSDSKEPELELAVAAEAAPADDRTLKLFDAQRRLLPRPWSELQPSPPIEWLAVPVAEGERERFLCRVELAGVERATFFPNAKAELDLARQSLEPSGSWQRLALELARREGAAAELPRAQGVLRLERGAEVTYFKLDLRQAPQPLPRK